MQVELSREEQNAMQHLVETGRFESVDEAVHVAVQNLAEEHDQWVRDVRANVGKGEDDLAAGRVVDGEEVMKRLKARAQRFAA